MDDGWNFTDLHTLKESDNVNIHFIHFWKHLCHNYFELMPWPSTGVEVI